LYRPNLPNGKHFLKEESRYGEMIIDGVVTKYKRGFTIDEYTPFLKPIALKSPILGSYVSDYINRADVRTIMHVS